MITENGHVLNVLVDSRSTACTGNEKTDAVLTRSLPIVEKRLSNNFDIVGCGGHMVAPTAFYDLTVTVYGFKVVMPVTLKKNAKVADVSPCSSIQDLPEQKTCLIVCLVCLVHGPSGQCQHNATRAN